MPTAEAAMIFANRSILLAFENRFALFYECATPFDVVLASEAGVNDSIEFRHIGRFRMANDFVNHKFCRCNGQRRIGCNLVKFIRRANCRAAHFIGLPPRNPRNLISIARKQPCPTGHDAFARHRDIDDGAHIVGTSRISFAATR